MNSFFFNNNIFIRLLTNYKRTELSVSMEESVRLGLTVKYH